jgi:hypothetical protein
MSARLNLDHLYLSILATVIVFLLTCSYAPSARAAVTETLQANQAAPVVLAWYNRGGWGWRGYGYRGGWYRDGYGYRGAYQYNCPRTCYRNRWGNVECFRRC